MSNTKEVKEVKRHLKDVAKQALQPWKELDVTFKETSNNLSFILHCLETGQIKIKRSNQKEGATINNTGEEKNQKAAKNKQKSTTTAVTNGLDDTATDSEGSGTSTSRSLRPAARAADEKRALGQSMLNAKKLRRPTDFDKKKAPSASASTAARKNRETYCHQPNTNTTENMETGESLEVKSDKVKECIVDVERLNTPKIKSLTRRSNTCKRKSEDLFQDSPCQEISGSSDVENELPSKIKKKAGKKKSETKHETEFLSPPACDSPFLGFNSNNGSNSKKDTNKSVEHLKTHAEKDNRVNRNTVANVNNQCMGESIEVMAEISSETKTSRSRTKTLKKGGNEAAQEKFDGTFTVSKGNQDEQVPSPSACSTTDDKMIGDERPPARRTRTTTLHKKTDSQGSEEEVKPSSRTKTIRKVGEPDEQVPSPSACSTTDEKMIGDERPPARKTRTTTLHKKTDSQSSEEEVKPSSRTKTIRKVGEPAADSESDSGLKKLQSTKRLAAVESPASLKGEMVKKRVEDFEKMKSTKVVEEEKTTSVRVTRNKAKEGVLQDHKKKQVSSQAAASTSKVIPVVEKGRLTPLSGSRTAVVTKSTTVNRFVSSAKGQESDEQVVQKQFVDQEEKKALEKRRQLRHLKEMEAQKKKEIALKATVERNKRKREEKHLKVVATKEAAEREKALIAAKADKEKEEKLRLAAAEKEKQKEEYLKKKLQQQQQHALEMEERRRQEEAARIAKLKEQEIEHKRALALKEREQELLQKQQRAAELRLEEAERAKHQQVPKATKLQLQVLKLKNEVVTSTPSQPHLQSYEITPAKEDRPLLKPKTETDYGIEDANSDDSSDDEARPKKKIPEWAQTKNRLKLDEMTGQVPADLWDEFWGCAPSMPDVHKMFTGFPVKKRIRTSSAVWRTPPCNQK